MYERPAKACGNDEEDEAVTITNSGSSSVNLAGWTLTDEGAKHSYTFTGATVPVLTRERRQPRHPARPRLFPIFTLTGRGLKWGREVPI
ncbi:hypothetical protein Mpal_1427 [Methanosphaerula palustris E1-9c]|uniref:LTD domain-containing protein n=1 Tax=Methanosphaerula palustris (strain ATCC BAA-1556 / DSM 19958 / E1-9c) TaxID=521011 RepID=B8GI13_METPE|nr:hypothetical protein Mpal_1427 [Methanosphaerula palustris E1-9c]